MDLEDNVLLYFQNYRTTLRPGKLKVIQVKEKAVNRLSDCPIDGTMLNEFEFTAQKRADYEAVGLVRLVFPHPIAFPVYIKVTVGVLS